MPDAKALADRFLSLPPEGRRVVHERLVEQALARWEAYADREGPIYYRESVVGTEQLVDERLPADALAAVRSGQGIAEVDRRYGEPLAALQDGDLSMRESAQFAYCAVLGFFRKYGLGREVDDVLIVNQACASEEDDRRRDRMFERAIDGAEGPGPTAEAYTFSEMRPALRAHFADYGAFHATPGNKACHAVGIPLIYFSVVALLAHVPLGRAGGLTLTLAEPVLLAVSLYYLRLDAALGTLMLVLSAAMAAAGRFTPVPVAAVLFVVGWVLQFIGHYVYEKKSPAFFRNAVHLLVGPLWILAKAARRS